MTVCECASHIERRPTRYDLHVSILQKLFVVHWLFSLSWNVSLGSGSEKFGLGSAGVASPSADCLASFDQLQSCTALLLSLSLILQQLRLSYWLRKNKRETVKDCRHSNTCWQPFFAKTCVQKGEKAGPKLGSESGSVSGAFWCWHNCRENGPILGPHFGAGKPLLSSFLELQSPPVLP